MVAAVVTPTTMSLCLRMTPAPMKPIPERTPKGKRRMSMFTKELAVFPVVPAIRFASIIAIDAAMQTSIVVLMPAVFGTAEANDGPRDGGKRQPQCDVLPYGVNH